MDESSLLRLDPDELLKLDEQESKILNSTLTSPKTIIQLPTKFYVDCFHESSRNRRDLSLVFNDQDIEFDTNKLTNLDSVSVNRIPSSDHVLVNKKHLVDELYKNNILMFDQTLKNYIKVSVGKDT